MNDPIRFVFEGISYTVPAAFYDSDGCVLPDGRVLRAAGFLESLPPQPQGLHVVDEPAAGLPRAEVQP